MGHNFKLYYDKKAECMAVEFLGDIYRHHNIICNCFTKSLTKNSHNYMVGTASNININKNSIVIS